MLKQIKKTTQGKKNILIKPRVDVAIFLQNQIFSAQKILDKEIRTDDELHDAEREKTKWHKFNSNYLMNCFNTDCIAKEYDSVNTPDLTINSSIYQKTKSFKMSLHRLIDHLESIKDGLSFFQENLEQEAFSIEKQSFKTNKIFIVHGHDETLKHKVARFVNKLELEAIILDEQANEGMTIIEKFEQHAKNAGYAIVLLTHDDMGYPKDTPSNIKPRARQNAIAELGYFLCALGRKNMAILCSDHIEIPSDFSGVIYLPTANDQWELRLATEMKAAGLNIDMNKLC